DELVIKTWVAGARSALSTRKYEIRHVDGTLLAKAETDWVFINYQSQRPVRIPPEVTRCFEIVQADSKL
ncbi:MAG: acyl-ACP thioesterase domain-containing protein, partial [Lysobacterales bacterium]